VVDASAPHGDEAETPAFAENPGGEARVGADVHDHVRVPDAAQQLGVAVGAAFSVDRHIAERTKLALSGCTGERRWKIVGDNDAEACRNVGSGSTKVRVATPDREA
jgi:hypothetical protein